VPYGATDAISPAASNPESQATCGSSRLQEARGKVARRYYARAAAEVELWNAVLRALAGLERTVAALVHGSTVEPASFGPVLRPGGAFDYQLRPY